MKRHLIIPFLLLSLGFAQVKAQSNKESIQRMVDSLSWNSVRIVCRGTILTMTHSSNEEKEILKIGKEATPQLMAALSDSSKTVIAHVILSQIWEPKSDQNSLWTSYIYKECNKLDGWHHIYNGLIWEWDDATDRTIKQQEIYKIKNYWTAKLIAKKRTPKFDARKILDEIYKSDKILFPCSKVYGNNSALVKSDDLFNLLNKKSDDPLFEALWKTFGNDSTNSVFEDCFYINYGAEGLSFRFEKDSTLSSIFVEPPYKGELPHKLKLTDRRTVIEKKLGKPSDSSEWSDNVSYTYKEQHLFLDFDAKGKMIKFGISSN